MVSVALHDRWYPRTIRHLKDSAARNILYHRSDVLSCLIYQKPCISLGEELGTTTHPRCWNATSGAAPQGFPRPGWELHGKKPCSQKCVSWTLNGFGFGEGQPMRPSWNQWSPGYHGGLMEHPWITDKICRSPLVDSLLMFRRVDGFMLGKRWLVELRAWMCPTVGPTPWIGRLEHSYHMMISQTKQFGGWTCGSGGAPRHLWPQWEKIEGLSIDGPVQMWFAPGVDRLKGIHSGALVATCGYPYLDYWGWIIDAKPNLKDIRTYPQRMKCSQDGWLMICASWRTVKPLEFRLWPLPHHVFFNTVHATSANVILDQMTARWPRFLLEHVFVCILHASVFFSGLVRFLFNSWWHFSPQFSNWRY